MAIGQTSSTFTSNPSNYDYTQLNINARLNCACQLLHTPLNKPFFNPPHWLFGPVWITLYLLMGISLYLIWNNDGKDSKSALIVFSIQLGLNTLWSLLFFGLKNPLLAFIEIILLWLFIVLTILFFYQKSKTASFLLIPYLLWVSFASVLNFSIFYLN
jgi:benzodiazapine receptor